MRSLLVTGGAGFIGSNFVHYMLSRHADIRITNLDVLTYAGVRESLDGLSAPDRHSFVEGDICDERLVNSILADHEIDTIVHFAAESHVDRSISGPAAFVETNIEGTFNLLEAARAFWLRGNGTQRPVRFHHVSTDEVYGRLGPSDAPFSETTPYDPSSPYAASKAASDHLVRAYGRTYGLPFTISNCSNNYGPRQLPEKLIPLTLQRALAGEPIPIYGDGRQIRDWLYVDDHCAAIDAILERGSDGETYNVGGGNQPTNLEIVRRICRHLDSLRPAGAPHDRLITFVKDRPGHDRRYAIDFTKINRELGWEPTEDLDSGLKTTIRWYLDNEAWVDAVTSRPSYRSWVDQNYARRAGA